MPAHVTHRDLPRTAWLQAVAYATSATARSGKKRRHPQAWAILAWAGVFTAHCLFGHRNLYLTSSRLGVVCFYKRPPVGIIARGAVWIAPLVAVTFSASVLLTVLVTLLYLAVLGSMTVSVMLTGKRSKAPKGTPKAGRSSGPHVIGLAAAHPDARTGETALLAARLVRALPVGSVVVVHPRTPELRKSYERAGFKPSKGLEMRYRVERRPSSKVQ